MPSSRLTHLFEWNLQYVSVPTSGDVVVAEVRFYRRWAPSSRGLLLHQKTDGIGQMSHSMVLAAARKAGEAATGARFP